jgi:hypothetical protein
MHPRYGSPDAAKADELLKTACDLGDAGACELRRRLGAEKQRAAAQPIVPSSRSIAERKRRNTFFTGSREF